MKETVFVIALLAIVALAISQSNSVTKVNNERFDTCFATYQSEGMPREMYNEFMRDCFSK